MLLYCIMTFVLNYNVKASCCAVGEFVVTWNEQVLFTKTFPINKHSTKNSVSLSEYSNYININRLRTFADKLRNNVEAKVTIDSIDGGDYISFESGKLSFLMSRYGDSVEFCLPLESSEARERVACEFQKLADHCDSVSPEDD